MGKGCFFLRVQSLISSLILVRVGGCWLLLPSLLRMYSLNWDESAPPPHEHVIWKPLCCKRSSTCSSKHKTEMNHADLFRMSTILLIHNPELVLPFHGFIVRTLGTSNFSFVISLILHRLMLLELLPWKRGCLIFFWHFSLFPLSLFNHKPLSIFLMGWLRCMEEMQMRERRMHFKVKQDWHNVFSIECSPLLDTEIATLRWHFVNVARAWGKKMLLFQTSGQTELFKSLH